eukprot:3091820-Rhodomonas_salina.1
MQPRQFFLGCLLVTAVTPAIPRTASNRQRSKLTVSVSVALVKSGNGLAAPRVWRAGGRGVQRPLPRVRRGGARLQRGPTPPPPKSSPPKSKLECKTRPSQYSLHQESGCFSLNSQLLLCPVMRMCTAYASSDGGV